MTTESPKEPVRAVLDPSRVASEALRKISTFHADVVAGVQRALAESPVVVVGMAQNPHVKNVRKALAQAGIEFTYVEHGSYFSGWSERLAIKLWSGWPTFPQVFVNGTLLGGEDLTLAALRDGSLARMLAARS
jgi:glutaredoxin-related protein